MALHADSFGLNVTNLDARRVRDIKDKLLLIFALLKCPV